MEGNLQPHKQSPVSTVPLLRRRFLKVHWTHNNIFLFKYDREVRKDQLIKTGLSEGALFSHAL